MKNKINTNDFGYFQMLENSPLSRIVDDFIGRKISSKYAKGRESLVSKRDSLMIRIQELEAEINNLTASKDNPLKSKVSCLKKKYWDTKYRYNKTQAKIKKMDDDLWNISFSLHSDPSIKYICQKIEDRITEAFG